MDKTKIKNKIQKYVNFPDKESRDELDKLLNKLCEKQDKI
jgi:hypothetical protein